MFTNHQGKLIGSWTSNANNASENYLSIISWASEIGEGGQSLVGLWFRFEKCRIPVKRLLEFTRLNFPVDFVIGFNPIIGGPSRS